MKIDRPIHEKDGAVPASRRPKYPADILHTECGWYTLMWHDMVV